MIGSNTMWLNQATMISALQHYFDTILFKEGKSPSVKSVRAGHTTNYETKDCFEVNFSTKEQTSNVI